MIFSETKLKGAFVVDIEKREDERGFFARTFCADEFKAPGLNPENMQTNIAYNRRAGTFRGLHFQFPPAAETKLVRCTRGSILDIIIDLRPESDTYLEHFIVELSADNYRALYIPERFAHGYQALEDHTDICYQAGEFYSPASSSGLAINDPYFGIKLPLPVSVISESDQNWKHFAEIKDELTKKMTV